MTASRILSHLFKQNWRAYFGKRNLYQPSGKKPNPAFQYLDYLQSSAGKKALFVGASLSTLSVFIVKMLPNSPLTQKYIQMFYQSYYSPDQLTPVTRRFGEDIINKVVHDMELSEEQAKSLTFFAGNLAEPSATGCFSLGSVLVGIPPHFNVFEEDELPDILKAKFGMKVGDDVPDISTIRSREGKSFRESLYLSEEAKRFAVARELYWALTNPIFVHPAISAIAVHLIYTTCHYVNAFLPFLRKSFTQRWGMYAIVGFFFYVLHKKTQDFFFNNRICNADMKAATISPAYMDGGLEYYEKLLKRNVALRTLIPHKRGARLYNLKGNPTSPLFGSKLTISQRMRLLTELNS